MKKLLKNKKGFTLIELIVVIAILAILAAILIPSITNYIDKANEAKNQANARANYSEIALAAATDEYASTLLLPECSVTTTTDTSKDLVSVDLDTFSCTFGTTTFAASNDFVPSN